MDQVGYSGRGVKDTSIDNAKDSIPNRVQRYELVSGDLKKAPPMDVSSRFGGGGADVRVDSRPRHQLYP